MINSPASSETLAGRECALQAILRDVLEEYRGFLEEASQYEAYLQNKVNALERFAYELDGERLDAPDLDEDIPF